MTFYLMQTSMVLHSVLASVLAAALLLCIPNKVLFRGKEVVLAEALPATQPMRSDEYISARLKAAGNALQQLKNAIAQGEQKRTEKEEKNMDSILAHLSRTVCADCGLKGICWDMDLHETYHDVLTMFAIVESKGVLLSKDVPNSFKKRCSHRKEIVATVNCLYEMYRKNEYLRQQSRQSKSLLTMELENAVYFLGNLNENISGFVAFREILNKKLSASLRNNGFDLDYIQPSYVDDVHVDLRLKTRFCKGEGRCGRVISSSIWDLTGRKFYLREYACGAESGKSCFCRFYLADVLRIDAFSQQIPKDKETVSGDVLDDFILAEAKHCFVLSDGMGCGETAKKEAESTVSLIRDIIQSGFNQDFAAAVLNYLTMNKEKNETYATADICMLDLKNFMAEFVKIGAAPSYICSPDKGIKVVAGNSLSSGENDTEKPIVFREKLSLGDIVIMVSDGVTETDIVSDEMEYWLTKTVQESQKESAKVIGERILSGALNFCGGKAKDDMSITVFVVE